MVSYTREFLPHKDETNTFNLTDSAAAGMALRATEARRP
jgi:hypothetical protein